MVSSSLRERGAAKAPIEVAHLAPLTREDAHAFTPFGGAGTRPPPAAGHVAELRLAPVVTQIPELSITMMRKNVRFALGSVLFTLRTNPFC